MNFKNSNEDRRHFLKKILGGLAATTTLPWIASPSNSTAAISNFYQTLEKIEGGKDTDDEKFWTLIKEQFPLEQDLIYMNNGGLGPSPYQVIETIKNQMWTWERISETGHWMVEGVHEKAAKFFNCGIDEIAFTRNSTESMNIIARGIPLKKGDEVLMTTHEHPGGAMPWLGLAKDTGIQVKLFEPDLADHDNLKIVESNITSRTKVLMISHIPCTTGLIFPVKEIAEFCHQKGIYVVYDGAQVLGMIPVNLNELGCDFYTSSGHKWLCGPKGTGILYIRREMLDVWHPTYIGAYSEKVYNLDQLKLEYGKAAYHTEYGTRNTPIIMGIGASLDFLGAIGMDKVAARDRALATHLKEQLVKIDKVELLTPMEPELSGGIVTFKILDNKKSYTDYISQIKEQYNIRLRPIGEHNLNAIRASLHVYTTFEQVDRLVEAIKQVIS
jgi:selenocysteine lyase/cysteine desulfurase